MIDDLAFQEYANATTRSGYLKAWKARSMLWTLQQIPQIFEDDERLIKYVKGCLEMEGFRENECILIAVWLFVQMESK